MSVLAVTAVLALLIVVHELGHFMAARLQGIHVNRFSIGFGPVLWKYQGPQTEYAVRAFPLGGFVGFPDDDPDSDIALDDPNLLRNRPIMDRAIVISAGVIANLVFAYFVFVAQFTTAQVAGIEIADFAYEPGVSVPEVISADSPAAQAGIQDGDIIVAVDGAQLGASDMAMDDLMQVIRNSADQPILLTLQRDAQELDVTVTPETDASGNARIGVQLAPNGTITSRKLDNFFEIFGLAAERFQDAVIRIVQGFVMLVTNFSSLAGQVAGPVKIVEQGAGLASNDMNMLFPFTAIISINLAIINILPLPALDGGQLAFLLIEGLRGKPLPTRLQENVMQTGIVLLLGLGVFLIVRDTLQLEVLQNFFQ